MQTRWVLLIMGLVWALTAFPMLGAVGFATTVGCRVALGAGEGPAFPVALHLDHGFDQAAATLLLYQAADKQDRFFPLPHGGRRCTDG